MKKFILGAVALVSLTYQAVAQDPTAPSSTPSSTTTTTPAPPPVSTTPTNPKEKGEKHRGDHDNNKGGERKEERTWENHGRKNKKEDHKGKKEERGERKEEHGEHKEERGERKSERKEDRKEQKMERKEQKMERKEQKIERKEARAEKLDKMKAYLNLSADQESRMSNAIQSFRTGAKAVKENKNLSADQKKAQFDKLVAERNAQLKSILTPDQLAKLAEAQKQGLAQGKGRNGFISDEMGDDDLF
ncbi:MAG: hypothetical protein RIS64_1140 [Bacteroidota bacterium]|jgi:hypothetical protein